MPQGPMGAPRPAANAKLQLYTTYQIPFEEGQELEDIDWRRNLEDGIQEELRFAGFRDASVELGPAGRTLGVTVELTTDSVTSSDEEEILDILDNMINRNTSSSSRPSPDEPEYEWRAV